jgi:hypothetical protein
MLVGYCWENQVERPVGRPRRRRMDLGEIGWGGVDWICPAQDKDNWTTFVDSVMTLRVS